MMFFNVYGELDSKGSKKIEIIYVNLDSLAGSSEMICDVCDIKTA